MQSKPPGEIQYYFYYLNVFKVICVYAYVHVYVFIKVSHFNCLSIQAPLKFCLPPISGAAYLLKGL